MPADLSFDWMLFGDGMLKLKGERTMQHMSMFSCKCSQCFSCKCSCDAATFRKRCNAAYSNANRFDISPVNAVAENRCVRPMSAISISMCSSFCFEIFNFWDFDFTSFVPILCQRLTPCLFRIQALIFNA